MALGEMEANVAAYISSRAAQGKRGRAYQSGKPTKPFKEFVEQRIRAGETTWFYDPLRAFNPDGRNGKGSKVLLSRIPKRQQLVGQVFRSNATEHVRRYAAGDPALRNNDLVEDQARALGLTGVWRVVVAVGGDVRHSQTHEMNTQGLESLHKYLMSRDSDFSLWNIGGDISEPLTITFTKETRRVGSAYTQQAFRDGGVRHCVLDATADFAQARKDKSESVFQGAKYQAIINKIRGKPRKDGTRGTGLLDLYANGIPEDKLAAVARYLNIGIDVSFPFLKERIISVRPERDPMFVMRFLNWRVNHVDCLPNDIENHDGWAQDNREPILLSRKQLYKKWCELKESGTFCWAKKSSTTITRVSTLENAWAMDDKGYGEWVKEFEKNTGLNHCYFNATENPEAASFIQAAQHYNGTIDFHPLDNNQSNWSGIHHYDQAAAYKSYKAVDGYKENLFPAKMTDFRKTDRVVGPGVYRIVDLDWSNAQGNIKEANDIMRIYVNGNVYPSPDLWRLKKRGVGFKITHGAWATETLDFDMGDADWDNEVDDIRFYCKFVGAMGSFRNSSKYYLAGDNQIISYLANSDVLEVRDTGDEASLWCRNNQIKNLAHVNAFITAYQRMAMLDQLEVMDLSQVDRVVVDGIYTREADVPLTSTFRKKNDKMTFKNAQCTSYVSSMVRDKSLSQKEIEKMANIRCIDPPPLPTAKFQPLAHATLDKGPGGNGKTYHEMNDTGHISRLYVGPYHLLAGETAAEYQQNVSIHGRLFRDQYKNFINNHSVLLIDECSMLTEEDTRAIIDRYPYHKLIFMGDIGYQCEPTTQHVGTSLEEITDFTIFDRIVEFNHDYRALCPKLRLLKQRLRQAIDRGDTAITDKDIQFGTTEGYTPKDIILAYKNRHCAEHTAQFAEMDKFKVLETKNGLFNGQIILEDVEGVKTEKRHGFTCHCVQGRTMTGKIFIDQREIKNMRMLYVAVSRARWLSQIVVLGEPAMMRR